MKNSKLQKDNKLVKANTKKSTNDPPKPKSLNEAIANYTGNKYLTHKERKRKRKLQERNNEEKQDQEEEEEEDNGERRVTKKAKRGMWDSIKSFLLGTPTPLSDEEDLGENIEENREQKEEKEEEGDDKIEDDDSSSSGEVLTETSPFTGFSEPEKSEIDDIEEEEDDADFVDEDSDSPESSDQDDEDVESDSVSSQPSDNDEEDLEKLKYDLKIDQLVNGKDDNEEDEDEDEEEEETQERTSTTPPTSPEEDTEKQQPEPLEVSYYDINEYEDDRGSNNSTRIYKNWRELVNKKPPVGLLNHGVTCYMNSAIQSIIHIPAMQHYLNDVNDNKYSQLKPRSVTHVLAELSKRMWLASNTNNNKKGKNSGGMKYINPKKIIQRLDEINCMMSEWQQEDSHEYYMSLISRLQEDSTPKGKKLNESIIYDIFGGLLNQRITCHKCHNVSITKQEFYDLSLGLNKKKAKPHSSNDDNNSINNNNNNNNNNSNDETTSTTIDPSSTTMFNSNKFSIEKSINDFFSNELIKKLENDSKSGYFCEKCNRFTHANKISSIEIAPETLTIHFKRFKFNNNSSSKVKQLINYSKYLDLSKYMVQGTAKYRLTSVIVHEGRSISSGHYVAHCLQPDGYTWCTYDDEYINKIEERVALNDPSAYVLVYTKLTPKV